MLYLIHQELYHDGNAGEVASLPSVAFPSQMCRSLPSPSSCRISRRGISSRTQRTDVGIGSWGRRMDLFDNNNTGVALLGSSLELVFVTLKHPHPTSLSWTDEVRCPTQCFDLES